MQPPFDIAADLDTPVSAWLKLKALKPRYLLESVEGGERLARYSFLGFGDGLFAAPQTYPVVGRPTSLIVADLDGDGIDDIAATGFDAGTVTTFTSFAHP